MKSVWLLALILVSVLLISGGCANNPVPEEKEDITIEKVIEEKPLEQCDKVLTHSPIDIKNLKLITPQGLVSDSHVTPVDHQYWSPLGAFEKGPQNSYNVYTSADGIIDHIGKFTSYIGDSDYESPEDYRLIINHPCNLKTIYIHLTTISEELLNEFEKNKKSGGGNYISSSVNINVKGGDIIGTIKGKSFDFSLHDYDVILEGFISPEYYSTEEWKIHTVDPFDYFEEPLKTQLKEKSLRTLEPRGGKIDYDIKGAIVGNWFEKGTNGYQGSNQERYWAGHLAIVYDHIDPSQIRISIGTFDGKAQQFGVISNSPDPKDVSSGLAKYELSDYEYYSGENYWNRITFAKDITSKTADSVKGVALFELLEDQTLKAEFFPEKNSLEVEGFTNNFKIYER